MAEQSRKPKPKAETKPAEATETTEKDVDTADVDDLLAEIDEVLETNAEEFVRSYVQKGGQ
jgi:prokaryotic ubiquitin-like protein Pup